MQEYRTVMIGHLDVAYGCAALKEWGVHIFKDFVRTHTTHIYYKDGDKDGDKNADTQRTVVSKKKAQQI